MMQNYTAVFPVSSPFIYLLDDDDDDDDDDGNGDDDDDDDPGLSSFRFVAFRILSFSFSSVGLVCLNPFIDNGNTNNRKQAGVYAI